MHFPAIASNILTKSRFLIANLPAIFQPYHVGYMIYAPDFMWLMPSAYFSFVILIGLRATEKFAGPLFCYFALYKNGHSCILSTVCYLEVSGA